MIGQLYTTGQNAYGQLGDGSGDDRSSPIVIGSYTSTSAGFGHTVAIDSAGTIWSWGQNSYGQLGNYSTSNYSAPISIRRGGSYVAVSAGQYHTLAIDSAGTIWSWGQNSYGQLGNYSTSNYSSPISIRRGGSYVAVDGGTQHTLAIDSAGKVWSWGRNNYGQLGNGSTSNYSSPISIRRGGSYVAVSAGQYHTLAIDSAGTIWSWGRNNYGQLGNGSTSDYSSPISIRRGGSYVAVSAGDGHTVAIDSAGMIWAWGNNLDGQLGEGTTDLKSSPVSIIRFGSYTSISAGGFHTVAVDSDGIVWVWGYNDNGQLGNNSILSCSSPVSIARVGPYFSVSAGGTHSVFMATDTIAADFSGTPTSGYLPLTVNFTDLTTGTPTTWSWDFGDGSTSTSQNPSHIYTAPGTYTVELTASNLSSTSTETKTAYVTVYNVEADFSGTPLLSYAPLTVIFTNSSLGSPTSWLWNFGDGNTSTDQNPVHIYSTWGLFTVSLTAYKINNSNTETKIGYVFVPNQFSDDRYWVAAGNSTWNTPSNWAVYSGGATINKVPNSLSNVYFDVSGSGNCSIDTTVNINSLSISGYRDTVSQNSNHIYVSSSMILRDGTFVGSGADMTVGSLTTTSDFTCTEGTMVVNGDFLNSGSFDHNSGTVLMRLYGSLLDTTTSPIFFNRFICDATVELDGTATIWSDLVLNSGALGRGRVNIYGDLTCGSSYNSWLSNNNAMLVMVGVSNQTIYNVGGGVLPSLWIDKS